MKNPLETLEENAKELGLDYEPVQDGGIVTAGGLDPRTRRTWVGLTNKDVYECEPKKDWYDSVEFARAIEAKLKEKNT